MSFSMEHVGLTEQLFSQCKIELNIFLFAQLYTPCVKRPIQINQMLVASIYKNVDLNKLCWLQCSKRKRKRKHFQKSIRRSELRFRISMFRIQFHIQTFDTTMQGSATLLGKILQLFMKNGSHEEKAMPGQQKQPLGIVQLKSCSEVCFCLDI